MTLAEDVAAAAAEVGASAQAAADRVTAAIAELRGELAAAQDRIQEFLDSDAADTSVLTEAMTSLQNADSIVDSIEADDTDTPEEPTEPEPTPEEPTPEPEPTPEA